MSWKSIIDFLEHVCDIPGCSSVIVVDGNMKNARQVCGCKEVGELYYPGMNGSIMVGKLNMC